MKWILVLQSNIDVETSNKYEAIFTWATIFIIFIVAFIHFGRKWNFKRQYRRWKDDFDRVEEIYQPVSKVKAQPLKPVDTGLIAAGSQSELLGKAQKRRKAESPIDVYDSRKSTVEAILALPRAVPYIEPHTHLQIPFLYDGKEWHSLPLSTDECAVVCGARRRGKGNALQLLALSALLNDPKELQVWVLDLKQGLDYGFCKQFDHARLYADGEEQNVDGSLAQGYLQVLIEMRRREAILAKAGKRNIYEYNRTAKVKLPLLLLICDEVADLPTKFPEGWAEEQTENVAQLMVGGLQGALQSIARLSGAAGIILVAATQRPTRDVLDGQIQANTPNRIVLGLANSKDTPVAFSLGGGEKALYEPSLINEPGIAVYRSPSFEVIGRVPEISETVRDELISRIAIRYPRTKTLDKFIASGIGIEHLNSSRFTFDTGNDTDIDTSDTTENNKGLPERTVKALSNWKAGKKLSQNDILALLRMNRNKAIELLDSISDNE
jgi:hypothetical protein